MLCDGDITEPEESASELEDGEDVAIASSEDPMELKVCVP